MILMFTTRAWFPLLTVFGIACMVLLAPLRATTARQPNTNYMRPSVAQNFEDTFGTGADGVMPGSGNLDNANGFAAGIVNSGNAGTTSITVSDASSIARVQPGDAVLIHQSQGTGAGCWELNRAVSDFVASTGTYQLAKAMACNYITTGGNKAQILRVPQYTACNVTGTVTPLAAWNGNWGGLFAIMCSGTLSVTGSINANGYGYRGGLGSKQSFGRIGYQGESYTGLGTTCTTSSCRAWTPNAGGGGANGALGLGSGTANGGGYGSEGQAGWPEAGNSNRGGVAHGDAALASAFLGSGGGGGYENGNNPNAGGNGGNGGGAIFIWAKSIQASNAISADGGNGVDSPSYPGAAGSGGAIRLMGETINLGIVRAAGGIGGTNPLGDRGGNGGVGRIRVEYCTSLAGTTNPAPSVQQVSCSFLNTPTPTATGIATSTATPTPTQTPTSTDGPSPTPTNPPSPTPTPTTTPSTTGDAYERDDTCAEARTVPNDGSVQQRTFHHANDDDWIKFQTTLRTSYVLVADSFTNNALVYFTIRPSCNSPIIKSTSPTFNGQVVLPINIENGFPPGTYWVRVSNVNSATFTSQAGYALSLRTTEAGGAAIIVAGRNGGAIHQQVITQTTDLAYSVLRGQGFSKERILYIDAQTNRDVDGNEKADDIDFGATVNNVRYAIREWARDNVFAGEVLWIYLADHGLPNRFQVSGDESSDMITPEMLHEWLADLERDGVPRKIIIVIDACFSGTFVRAPLSQPGRVVVVSTASNRFAYGRSPAGNVVQRMYFSEMLFANLDQGLSLRDAFERAKRGVTEAGLQQFPGMDANGDGQANTPADASSAGGLGLLGTVLFAESPPAVVWNVAQDSGNLSVKVRSQLAIRNTVLEITRPDASTASGDGQVVLADVDRIALVRSQSNAQDWVGAYPRFDQPGVYRIVAYAWDEIGQAAQPSAIEVVVKAGWQRKYLPVVLRAVQ
jgi:hypothetical protein